ncbi:MAG TPA: hypothetical protein VGB71_07130, partial [Flavisolibacter sp.]
AQCQCKQPFTLKALKLIRCYLRSEDRPNPPQRLKVKPFIHFTLQVGDGHSRLGLHRYTFDSHPLPEGAT